MINNYVAVDLETTGLDPKKDRIIEIGMARVRDGIIVDTYETFINPGVKLTERITNLTGIHDEDLQNASYIDEKLDEVNAFIGEDVLLGHSILFDYSFLKRAIVNNGGTFEKEGIDTLRIARLFLSELPSRNLHQLCLHYNIEHNEHRALDDAIAAHKLYYKLIDDFYDENNEMSFAKTNLIYKVKKQGPITGHQKEMLAELIKQYNVAFPYEIDRLTKNEASRLIDIIRASRGLPQDSE